MAEQEHYIVFGSGKPWTLLAWSSDADFFYWGQSRDRTRSLLICCNASYLAARGKEIIPAQPIFSRCEITGDEGKVHVTSSEGALVVDKEAFNLISAEYQGKQG